MIRLSSQSFYVAGGTLASDALSYVQRDADETLFQSLLRGEYCYILTARQMGKSSLTIRTAVRLREQGVRVAIVDLTYLGQNLSVEQWYKGILNRIGRQLSLEGALDDFWDEQERLPPLERWLQALEKVILESESGSLVLFIDEIDLVRSLDFSTDEFFAAIRFCFNRRGPEPQFARLTFCLLGVAAPADLIDNPDITPFNIGRRIELRDFTLEEARVLAAGIAMTGRDGDKLIRRILYWTGGHPYLTQRLCAAVAEDESILEARQVDALCGRLLLSSDARQSESNLALVSHSILRSNQDVASLLDLYRQIHSRARVSDRPGYPLHEALRLSGIVRVVDRRMVVGNRIYARVFDTAWVTANMPDAERRRQRAAYRRGVIRAASAAALVVFVALGLALWVDGIMHGGVSRARSYTTLHRFGATSTDGQKPGRLSGSLLLGRDAFLYGCTQKGGSTNNGTVYRMNTRGGSYQILHQFEQSNSDGANPGSLIQGSDGSLYGFTRCDDADGYGTIFKVSPDGQRFQVLYPFGPEPSGDYPNSLIQGKDGALYGTAHHGVDSGNGTVFTLNASGKLKVLHTFTNIPGKDGKYPQGLMQATDGHLYGITIIGSRYNNAASGTVFRLDTSGNHFQTLYNFGAPGPCDVEGPINLTQIGDYLYGMTTEGGQHNRGAIFRMPLSVTRRIEILYSFGTIGGSDDGIYPYSGLLLGKDGYLYGLTTHGGAYWSSIGTGGTLFRIRPNGQGYQLLHSFGLPGDGCGPDGTLVEDRAGTLYGTTLSGGLDRSDKGGGTVFEFTPTPTHGMP